MDRQQRLVGRDDVLAGADRLEDQRPREAGAADQLDHDVDLGPRDQRAGVVAHLGGGAGDPAGARQVDIDDMADADLAAGATPDLLLVALQDGERAAADDPGAEQADLERLHANEGWLPDFAACRAR